MSRLIPRKRTVIGGVAVLGILAGIWLSGKLPHLGSGLGLGSGGDTLVGRPETSRVAVNAEDSDAANPEVADRQTPADHFARLRLPDKLDDADDDRVLTVQVEDRYYSVWKRTRKSNGYYPAELNEIVKLAEEATPNDEGIRVRIVRSKSARVTAWQSLQAELVKAGIPVESIVLQKELLE